MWLNTQELLDLLRKTITDNGMADEYDPESLKIENDDVTYWRLSDASDVVFFQYSEGGKPAYGFTYWEEGYDSSLERTGYSEKNLMCLIEDGMSL